jgi:hypothetical protein
VEGKNPAYMLNVKPATQILGDAEAQPSKQGTLSMIMNFALRELPSLPEYLRECRLHLTPTFFRNVHVLFDTGTTQGNFLSREFGEWIRNHRKSNGTGDPGTVSVTTAKGNFGNGGPVKLKKFSIEKPTFSNPSDQSKNSEVSEINLGGTEHNVTLYGTVTAHLDFMNEVTGCTNTLQDLKFQILETTFDVIIGRLILFPD